MENKNPARQERYGRGGDFVFSQTGTAGAELNWYLAISGWSSKGVPESNGLAREWEII